MLKLEKLDLQNGFTGFESEIASGSVTVTDSSENVVFGGGYTMNHVSGGVVASINAAGIVESEVAVVTNGESALTVNLHAIVSRSFEVKASDEAQTLTLDVTAESIAVDSSSTATATATLDTSNKKQVNIAAGATAGTLVLKVKTLVASGSLADDSISTGHDLKLSAGNAYMSMVSRVVDASDRKENVTSFKLDGSSELELSVTP